MATIRLERLEKRYAVRGGRVVALDDLSLTIERGERVAILGASGCGKTTLLRAIAGLERVDTGRIRVDDRDVTAMAPHLRRVAMVMQSGALYPHLRVRDNIEFPLRMTAMARAERDASVERVTAMLGIGDILDRRPAALSGGERQRVALAAALAVALADPSSAILLDEPFAALDAPLRHRLRRELREILDEIGRTTILVTHDQEEAIAIGHRIAMMDAGRLLQVGTATELLARPASRRVAAFIGSPPMTFIRGRLRSTGSSWRLIGAGDDEGEWALSLPDSIASALDDGGDVELGLRGGLDWQATAAAPGTLAGTVIAVESLGGHDDVHVRLADGSVLLLRRPPGAAPPLGTSIGLTPPAAAFQLFDAGVAGERLSGHRAAEGALRS